jgi:HK97 family phage major capsid protein
LSTIKAFSTAGSNMPLLQADPTQPSARTISGVPLLVSPAVAADIVWAIPREHSLFVLRQDATVVSDSSVMFTSDRTAIRATLRVSFGFTQPLSIVKITKA